MLKASMIAAGIILASVTGAEAADLTVLSAKGASLFLDALIPTFERTTGNKVSISYDEAGVIRKRVLGGEAFDLTISPSGWDEVKTMVAGAPRPIAHTDFGLGVLATAPKPDTSTNEALKRALLAARAIVYTDPASGGQSGVLFLRMITKLGVADEINKKSKLVTGVLSAKFLSTGEADLVAQSSSEILAVPGSQFLPLPAEFSASIVFSGAVAAGAKQGAAAEALLQFLLTPEARAVIKGKGYEPG